MRPGPTRRKRTKVSFSPHRGLRTLLRRRADAHSDLAIQNKKLERSKKRGANTGVLVNSFSYLPATVTSLFFLAASLLLGLMH
jgi:hypothetical protein